MKLGALSELADIIMGQSPPSSAYNMEGKGLPFFQGKAEFGDLYPVVRVFCTEPKKIAETGDILISVRAPVGPTNINPHRSCIGRGLAAVRAKKDTDTKYLLYFLRWHEPKLVQSGTGSTFEAVSHDDLEEIQIPVQPIAEQRKISNFLSRADRLRRQRRYALELSNTYLQAVFLEMFGEQIGSGGGLSRAPLGELVTITGGGTPSRAVAEYYTGIIPWLTSKDMQGDYIFDTQEHVTEEAIDQSATKLVPPGSILIVVKSKVLMHHVPIAITRVALCHGQDIKSIQCSDQVTPEFIVQVLKHNEEKLLAQARGANTEGLTLPMLEEIQVPDIALALQQKFSRIAQKHECLRAQQREALRQAEMLFQTLLQQAFAGEL